MIGTILNAAGVVVGGLYGVMAKRDISPQTQVGIKNVLGILTVFVGLRLTLTNLGGGVGGVLKQLLIVVLALTLGRLTGRLLRLQKGMNYLGQIAQNKFARAKPNNPDRFNEGFLTCTILFCVGPMAALGAFQDGVNGQWHVLGIKAVMDGLATMAFIPLFGWGAMLSVIPLVAYQGTITLAAQWLTPMLDAHGLMNSVNATGGMLVFSLSLIMLNIRRVEVSDYLPSLAFAPLLTWWWTS
jgi:hypothetical protein